MSNFHNPRLSTGLTAEFEISQNVFTSEYIGNGEYHILENGKNIYSILGTQGEVNNYINGLNAN